MSQFFASGGQSIGVSALVSVLPMNIQGWSPLEWTGWISLQSKGLSRAFSNTTGQKHQFFSTQLSSQSNSHIHTWPQVFKKPFNFSFFSITHQGIDLDYHDIEWFALETNRDNSVVFEIASKYCISDSFVDFDGYSISSKGFLPTVVDIWSSELNSPIQVHLSLLIPRVSMFTLAISCLTTSNLPWFMDITFQVPMQYCH